MPILALVSKLFKKYYFWPTWFDQLNKSYPSSSFCFVLIYYLPIRPHTKFHANMSISFQAIQEILFLTNLVLTNSIKVIQARNFSFVLIHYLPLRPHTKFHANMSISFQVIQEILFFDQLALTNSIKVIQAQVFCFVLIYYLPIRPNTKCHVNRSSSFWNSKNKIFLTNSVYQLGGLTKNIFYCFLMIHHDVLNLHSKFCENLFVTFCFIEYLSIF